MAQEKVKIEFEIDGIEKSVASVDDLSTALKGVDKQAKKTEASLDEAADSAKDLGKETVEAGEAGEGAMAVLDEATGGLASRFKNVISGIGKMGKAFVTSFKAGIKGANGMKTALIATGIGAIIVGVGLLVTYWSDIVGFVNGVSSESKKQLDTVKETVAAQEEALDAISAQENSLKLQGKSEDEIRQLKIAQTDEVIKSLEAQLILQEEQKKAQVAAAERNRNIAQGIIGFLTLPITMLLGAVDALTAGLAYIGAIDEATSLTADFTGGLANLIFDPSEVEAEGEEAIKETEKQLMALKNKRDGFVLQDREEKKKKAEDDKAEQDRLDQEKLDKEKQDAQELADLKAAIREAEANTEAELRAKELEDLDLHYEELKLKAEAAGLSTVELEASQTQKIKAIKDKHAAEDAQRVKDAKQDAKDKADYEKDLAKQVADSSANVAVSALDTIASIAGAESAAGKASAVAAATISTYKGAASAYADTPGGPIIKGIAAAIAVASGIMSVKKIISTKLPTRKGGSGGGGGGSVPSMPAIPAFDPTAALDAAAAGGQGNNTIELDNQQGSTGNVIKAYVVSSEMTGQQEADQKINDLARL
tara:strand:+ start:29 stop:1810 length:1782 start_codon:yes stop_codon:yes gene_type:complete